MKSFSVPQSHIWGGKFMRFKLRDGIHYSDALGGYTRISDLTLQSKDPDSIGPLLIFWFFSSYRSDFQNWGSVSGTQTDFSNIHLFIY